MAEVNVDYAERMEGLIYGDGAAMVARAVAKAADGKRKAVDQSQAVYEALCKVADECGYKSSIEVFRAEPRSRLNDQDSYRVSWESGPYEWAIVASDALCQVNVFAEPGYSFDLHFYSAEDR